MLQRQSPLVAKKVEKALKRMLLLGGVIGFILGFLAFGVFVVNSMLKPQNKTHTCDVIVLSKHAPELSNVPYDICWYEVNFPVENNDLYVFVCPTPYTLSAQGYFGELNEEVITQFYNSCQQLQSYNPFEQNVGEVNTT